MATIKKFEDIQAWQKASEVSAAIYRLCKQGDVATDFGLRDQICRCSVSTQSNIAAGFGRKGNHEFVYFLRVAIGYTCEFRSQLYNLLDADYIDQTTVMTSIGHRKTQSA
ncbi:MAG: four helix bundle protein [Lentimonas sp.]|jgi:four helix bundle protein